MSAHNHSIMRARGLTKTYGDFHAVKGIDFDVAPGESFGLLGPNGAGKSTTMRMISGTLERTGGDLEILGLDPAESGPHVRAQLGVVPQEDQLDVDLNVYENLIMYGRYFGLPMSYLKPKAMELLDFAQLVDKRTKRVDDLSGGMKRRLVIARALINQPKILLLDEPTTGLDPQARHILWDRLFRLKEAGTTLILTTHYMDEAEQLSDRLIVVDEGKIMAQGSPAQLIKDHVSREVFEARYGAEHNAAMAETLSADPAVRASSDRVEALPDRVLIYTNDADTLSSAVMAQEHQPLAALTRRASLEDVFLTLTGRSLND